MTSTPQHPAAQPPPAAGQAPVWRSLRTQFLRQLLLPLVLAFVVAASITAITNHRKQVQAQTQWRSQILETFGSALVTPLWDCDDATVRGIVQTLAQMPMVQGVQLQDLCAKDTVVIGDFSAASATAEAAPAAGLPAQLDTPLVYRDEAQRVFTVGHLRLQFHPLSMVDTTSRGLAEQLGTFAAILLAMFAVVAWVFRRTIEWPLNRLRQAMLHQQPVHSTPGPTRQLHDELTDVTDVYDQLVQELQGQAQHDTLTGLGNRKVLEQNLELAVAHASAARHDKHAYVLLLDLDGFKPINDTYGHAAGDLVLQHVAQRLRDVMRDSDTVTRLGGDEFVIIANDYPDEQGMAALVERIAQAVEAPLEVQGHQLQVGASIGYARIPQDGVSSESLLAHADHAMYHAKQQRKQPPAVAPTQAH